MCERERDRETETQRDIETERQRDRKRVFVCVWERERQRGILSPEGKAELVTTLLGREQVHRETPAERARESECFCVRQRYRETATERASVCA